MLRALALGACIVAALATQGVDLSQATSQSSFSCLKGSGYSFAVARCYESVGQPDPNCPDSVKNAWNGGMAHVDVYLFPDPKRGDAAAQMSSMINFLASHGIHSRGAPPNSFGMVWLDIEGPGYWTSSQATNRAFFEGLVNQGHALGVVVGVYTSESQWSPIMGDYSGGSALPLWYAHYDGSPSFSDFRAFGGWTHPAIKQFQGTTSKCGAGIDLNWYPDFANNTRPFAVRNF
eukprot:m.35031 g.35031  ORF g.35031 m.35031 type:complete len:233 (+) comp5289_c0_seq1:940-1638(+)